MGFLSNLFGGGPKTTVVQSKIPEELAPYVKEVLGETQKLYEQRMGETPDQYQYAGQTIADLTPDQIKARGGIRGLVGGTDEDYRLAREGIIGGDERFTTDIDPRRLDTPAPIDATIERRAVDFGGAPTEFTSERFQPKEMSEYMSPYAAAVTEIEKREAEEDFAKLMPTFEKQAASMGGMSGMGSRAGVQAGILGSKHLENINKIQKRGLQEAYVDAQRRKAEDFKRFQDQRGFEERERDFLKGERDILTGLDIRDIENRRRESQFGVDFAKGERDFEKGERTFEAAQFANRKAREKSKAADLQRLASGQYSQKMRELGGLETIGATEEARSQKGLDRAYADWLERRERPETQLARYTSSIYGNPMLRSPSKTTTTPGIPLGQQMLGFGMAAMGMPQFGTAMAFGGRPQRASGAGGGGIASLMDNVVYRQAPGQVGEGGTSRRAAPSWRSHQNMGSPEFKNLLSKLSTPKLFDIKADRKQLEVDRDMTRNNLIAMEQNKNDPRYKDQYNQLQKRLREINRRLEKLNQGSSTTSAIPTKKDGPKKTVGSNNPVLTLKPKGDGTSTGAGTSTDAGTSIIKPEDLKKLGPYGDTTTQSVQQAISTRELLKLAGGRKEKYNNLMDMVKNVVKDMNPEKLKEMYSLTNADIDKSNNAIKKLSSDLKDSLTSIHEKYGKRANTPHPLFYMGIQAATNPNGLFAGMSEGLLQWSKVSRLDDKEFNEVQREIGKALYDHGVLELNNEKGILNAKNKLSAEFRNKLKNLPAEKLAIMNIGFNAGWKEDELMVLLAKHIGSGGKLKSVGTGYLRKDLTEMLLNEPILLEAMNWDRKTAEASIGQTINKNSMLLNKMMGFINDEAYRQAGIRGAGKSGQSTGDVQAITRKIIRDLVKKIKGKKLKSEQMIPWIKSFIEEYQKKIEK